MFSFCVNIQLIPEFPFCNLQIVNLYKNYEKINSIQDTVTAVTSFCGSGKTTCLPLILLSLSPKEGMQVPFFLLSKANQNQVKELDNFFRAKISKHVTITTDRNEFSELFKNQTFLVIVKSPLKPLQLQKADEPIEVKS